MTKTPMTETKELYIFKPTKTAQSVLVIRLFVDVFPV
jgi:hypothetical protein